MHIIVVVPDFVVVTSMFLLLLEGVYFRKLIDLVMYDPLECLIFRLIKISIFRPESLTLALAIIPQLSFNAFCSNKQKQRHNYSISPALITFSNLLYIKRIYSSSRFLAG